MHLVSVVRVEWRLLDFLRTAHGFIVARWKHILWGLSTRVWSRRIRCSVVHRRIRSGVVWRITVEKAHEKKYDRENPLLYLRSNRLLHWIRCIVLVWGRHGHCHACLLCWIWRHVRRRHYCLVRWNGIICSRSLMSRRCDYNWSCIMVK
jgi:hypothetical protein